MNRILGIFLLICLLSCTNDRSNRNPFLQEIGFRFDLNLNLPLFSPLTTIGNAVYINNPGVGTRGVFVVNSGIGQFRAFEASCPNHAPNSCSTMELNGTSVVCPCENYQYSLFTGQFLNLDQEEGRFFDLLEYRATSSGNTITISN